jgi:hypothetical protein
MDISAIREGDEITIKALVVREATAAMPGLPASLRAHCGDARLIVEGEHIVGHAPQIRVGDRVKTALGSAGDVRLLLDDWAVVKLDGRPVPVVLPRGELTREPARPAPEPRAATGDGPIEAGDLVKMWSGKRRWPMRGRVIGIMDGVAGIDLGDRETRWTIDNVTRIAPMLAPGWLNADVRVDLGEDRAMPGFVIDCAPSAAANPHTLYVATANGVKIVATRDVARVERPSVVEAPCDV